MSQITVIAVLKAKPGLESQVKQELEKMVEETQKEKGCINYDLHEQLGTPGTFLFHENWESQEALDNHMQTPHFINLTKIAGNLLNGDAEIGLFEQVKCSKPVRS